MKTADFIPRSECISTRLIQAGGNTVFGNTGRKHADNEDRISSLRRFREVDYRRRVLNDSRFGLAGDQVLSR